jgi:hypothetical protein
MITFLLAVIALSVLCISGVARTLLRLLWVVMGLIWVGIVCGVLWWRLRGSEGTLGETLDYLVAYTLAATGLLAICSFIEILCRWLFSSVLPKRGDA